MTRLLSPMVRLRVLMLSTWMVRMRMISLLVYILAAGDGCSRRVRVKPCRLIARFSLALICTSWQSQKFVMV